MKTFTRSALWVLLLTIWALVFVPGVYAEEKAAPAAEGDKEAGADGAASETPSMVEVLTAENFDEFVGKHAYSVVEFYAPWCGHCLQLAPEYEKAAEILAKEKPDEVRLAKVDAIVESELAAKFGVKGYPTLMAFRYGVKEEFKGGRSSDTIVDFVKQMTKEPVIEISKESELAEEKKGNPVTIIGRFKSNTSAGWKVFQSYAKEHRMFGRYIGYITSTCDDKCEDTVSVNRENEGETEMMKIKDEESLAAFVSAERFPLLGPINASNYEEYFSSGRELVWVTGTEEEYKSVGTTVREAAKSFRAEFNFIWLDISEFKDHAESVLGVSEYPSILVQHGSARYLFDSRPINDSAKLIKFIQDVMADKIERHLLSEPIPETNDEKIKIVVGKNFNDIVFQADKDVLLEVYAPWCGHCKKLEPIYEEFAENVKNNPRLTVAKMDGTKNESPNPAIQWTGFPTIFLVKAGETQPQVFDGARTLEGLTEFVNTHGSTSVSEPSKDEL